MLLGPQVAGNDVDRPMADGMRYGDGSAVHGAELVVARVGELTPAPRSTRHSPRERLVLRRPQTAAMGMLVRRFPATASLMIISSSTCC